MNILELLINRMVSCNMIVIESYTVVKYLYQLLEVLLDLNQMITSYQ